MCWELGSQCEDGGADEIFKRWGLVGGA
jgi:hypothetical protein